MKSRSTQPHLATSPGASPTSSATCNFQTVYLDVNFRPPNSDLPRCASATVLGWIGIWTQGLCGHAVATTETYCCHDFCRCLILARLPPRPMTWKPPIRCSYLLVDSWDSGAVALRPSTVSVRPLPRACSSRRNPNSEASWIDAVHVLDSCFWTETHIQGALK